MTISARLWTLVIASLISMMVLMAFSLNSTYKQLVSAKEQQLEITSDIVVNQIQTYLEQVNSGKISLDQAKQRASDWLKQVRYEGENYFWVMDRHPNMIMHPIKPALDGKDLSKTQDKVGNYLFVDMVKAIQAGDGLGYVEYYWSRPGEEEPVPKLSIVREIKELGWIVGTGIYIDDIDAAFQSALIHDLEISALALIILLTMAIYIIRQVSQSINTIVNEVEQVNQNMKLDSRLPVLENELGSISNSFNSLLENMSNSVTEANHVVSAIAQADFSQRIQGEYEGDLKLLKQGVNGSAENIEFMMLQLEQVINGIDSGKLDVKMDPQVPADFRNKVEKALESVAAMVNNTTHVMEQMTQGEFGARVEVEARGNFNDLKSSINSALDGLGSAINEINQVMVAQSKGDLTKKINHQYHGQLKTLQDAINDSARGLNETLTEISEVSDSVSSAATEVSEGSHNLNSRTQQMAASIEETAASMEEMNSIVEQNSVSAKQANQLSAEASKRAQEGQVIAEKAVKAMEVITDSSQKISDIIGLIDSIAFQTNLLALNAAVEAARAGEHGRGFAVVAGEVRNLAQKSADASRDIKSLIESSVENVEQGSQYVVQTGESLSVINDSINQASTIVAEISHSSSEQTSGINQINQSITDLDSGTQQNATLVEETTSASESLGQQADQLKNLIKFFRTN